MTEDASTNVINNYKGVMLCSRPNEKRSVDIEKPFCARVVPGQQLGINPVKPEHNHQQPLQSKKTAILSRHKKWLNQFKDKVHKTKQDIEEQTRKEDEKFKKIKELAQADRQRAKKMKEQYNQAATQVMSVLDDKVQASAPAGELNANNLRLLDAANQNEKKAKKGDEFKKKHAQRPVWAMTKEAAEQNEEKQVDELLDFFEQNNVSDFSQDDQVKKLLMNLKEKVQKMKQNDNWKEKEAQRIRKARQARQQNTDEDDKYSTFTGGHSEGRSVASERSQKKMEELRNKLKEPKDWDKHTVSEKSSAVNLQERIAKNLADEVLRNYPVMKGVHSNTSIRKLLQAQAARVMGQPIIRPVITTIVRQKQGINANTLPYLHRNPAI